MYTEYFGLTEDPFSITPDPKYTYLSERHREALAHLLYGVTEGGGFVQLTGEVGTGKTTLCRNLLMLLPDELNIALIFNPRQTSLELVASLCDELHVDYPADCTSIKVLVDRLNAYLLENHSKGRRTVAIIDEAQNLSFDALEQVRLLTNLETATQKLLRIILVGQPELHKLLSKPELRQLAQRITARYHLTPLDAAETQAYVKHRLEVAGYQRRLFTAGAMRLLPKLTGGVPRLINVLCGRAMLAAYGKQQEVINRRLLSQVAKELEGGIQRPRLRWAWGLAGILSVALALAAWRSLDPDDFPTLLRDLAVTATETLSLERPVAPSVEQPPVAVAEESAQDVDAESSDPLAASTTLPMIELSEPSPDEPPTTLEPPVQTVEPPVEATLQEDEKRQMEQAIDNALSLVGLLDDIANAFTTLFGYWQSVFPLEAEGSACEKASWVGLQCLYGRGNWDNLRFYNRPAVIELLLDSGKRYHVVVSALDDEQVTLDLGNRRVSVPINEIGPLWSGSYIVLWRPPKLSSTYLKLGSKGPDVYWLAQMLEQVDGQPLDQIDDPAAAHFDWQMTKRVMEFQRQVGLAADGIVGRQTLIKLKAAVDDPNTPALDRHRG